MVCRNIRQQTGNKGFPPFIGGKETKNGTLRSVQHEDVIYKNNLHKIPVQTQSGFTLFTMGFNEKRGGVFTFLFLAVPLIIRQMKNEHRAKQE